MSDTIKCLVDGVEVERRVSHIQVFRDETIGNHRFSMVESGEQPELMEGEVLVRAIGESRPIIYSIRK